MFCKIPSKNIMSIYDMFTKMKYDYWITSGKYQTNFRLHFIGGFFILRALIKSIIIMWWHQCKNYINNNE